MPDSSTRDRLMGGATPAASTRAAKPDAMDPKEWQARVELAAAFRLAVHFGLNEGICNHFSVMLSGEKGRERFLINPYGLHWSEITASDITEIDADGNRLAGPHPVEPTAFYIHSRIHLSRLDAVCVLHAHMPYATALTLLRDPELKMYSQNALQFYGQIAYDREYNGLALDKAEGDRIASKLGAKRVLFSANHGVTVVGPDVSTAFNDLYYLERACMNQVMALSTGGKLKKTPRKVAEATFKQLEGERGNCQKHFAALQRMLKRAGADFDR